MDSLRESIQYLSTYVNKLYMYSPTYILLTKGNKIDSEDTEDLNQQHLKNEHFKWIIENMDNFIWI